MNDPRAESSQLNNTWRGAHKAHTQLADKAHEDLNVAPNLDGGFADLFGKPRRRRAITGCGWEICAFIVEQIGELRPKPVDLQIPPCIVL